VWKSKTRALCKTRALDWKTQAPSYKVRTPAETRVPDVTRTGYATGPAPSAGPGRSRSEASAGAARHYRPSASCAGQRSPPAAGRCAWTRLQASPLRVSYARRVERTGEPTTGRQPAAALGRQPSPAGDEWQLPELLPEIINPLLTGELFSLSQITDSSSQTEPVPVCHGSTATLPPRTDDTASQAVAAHRDVSTAPLPQNRRRLFGIPAGLSLREIVMETRRMGAPVEDIYAGLM